MYNSIIKKFAKALNNIKFIFVTVIILILLPANLKNDFSQNKKFNNENLYSLSPFFKAENYKKLAFEDEFHLWENSEIVNDEYIYKTVYDTQFHFTIKPEFEKKMNGIIKSKGGEYGSLLISNPKTGAVLCLSEFSKYKNGFKHVYQNTNLPTASLFKIIVAACALEQLNVDINSVIAYKGRNASTNPWVWITNKPGYTKYVSLKNAFAYSINPVFGILASKVGFETLNKYIEAFGFNSELFDTEFLKPSEVTKPESKVELAELGSGLGKSKFSPLHSLLIISAIANSGTLQKPYLIEKVSDTKGQIVYETNPEPMRHIIKKETAQKIKEMMKGTVLYGSANKPFNPRLIYTIRDRRNRLRRVYRKTPLFSNLEIGGKTGTLSGDDPKGYNSWFLGIAPVDNPEIAISVVALNQTLYQDNKGSYYAAMAMREIFKEYRNY